MLIDALHQSATKGSHFLTEEENNYQIPLPAKTLTVQDTHTVFYYMKEIPERYQRMSASYAQIPGVPEKFCQSKRLL